ncbi:MAG: hypothetical protein IPH44_01925 [Myxococcales bacterium]|nr:hypothetical protein [Myxococcales bacterium]MBK7198075.1 hypothetical protein [Myxococcales bacterium]MBP6845294.1 hypothetical protein [Kofleriaceae bacterium]
MKRLLAALVLASAGAATAEPLAAVALAPDPLASTLVGPSGQVWQPDGHGAWTRDAGGGVAADVGGAVVAAQLVVVGKATPAYRLDPDGWQALRLGERGKTVMGGGPHPAFAIGRNVFVWKAKAWVRVGAAPAGIVALWAGSDSKVYVAGADRLWRLAGKRLVDHATASVTRFASGAAPLAIAADGALFDVAAKAAAPVVLGGERLTPLAATTAPDGAAWVFARRAAGPILARRVRGAWQEVAAPAVADDDRPLALAVHADGTVFLPLASGAVWLQRGGAWSQATLTAPAPPPRPGPGPARMP